MTDTKQPDALRLAKTLEALGDYNFNTEAAAELRRQYAEIESLRAERDNYKALCEEAKPFASRCVELRARLNELEKQEHAAFVNEQGFIVERDDMQISSGEKLYLAAGARPPEPAPAAVAGPNDGSTPGVWFVRTQERFGCYRARHGQALQPASASDNGLPGMWSNSDLLGGETDTAPAAQDDVKDAARLYPVVIDGLLWLCTKHGGTFKPVDDCAAVNPPLSWKNALAANKKEPT